MYQTLTATSLIFSLVLLIVVTVVFLLAQYKDDNSIMDIVYGPIFTVTAALTLWLTDSASTLSFLLIGLVGLWSARLGIRIWRKNHGQPEDVRYATWREEWKKRGDWYFILRSYSQINLLQGSIIFFVSTPLILSIAFGSAVPLGLHSWLVWLGIAVYAGGLTFEAVADYQLDRFIARKKAGSEPAILMKKGLFRYSRRPNYFGETLVWWGIALCASVLPFGYLAFISPLLITFIVTKVTGPMLENVFLKRNPEEYRQYMKETNYFIPLPTRAKDEYEHQNTVA